MTEEERRPVLRKIIMDALVEHEQGMQQRSYTKTDFVALIIRVQMKIEKLFQ